MAGAGPLMFLHETLHNVLRARTPETMPCCHLNLIFEFNHAYDKAHGIWDWQRLSMHCRLSLRMDISVPNSGPGAFKSAAIETHPLPPRKVSDVIQKGFLSRPPPCHCFVLWLSFFPSQLLWGTLPISTYLFPILFSTLILCPYSLIVTFLTVRMLVRCS